jgi:DNA-binding transcriptional LysR family regulator
MDLNSLLIFKKIAELGSFTKTAVELDLPKSAVSQRVQKLEEDLGGLLIHRTTRSLALTELGEAIYRHASLIMDQHDAMIELAASSSDASSGLIRMTAPPDIGTFLIRTVLNKFMTDHPAIRVELDLSTRFVDMYNEGYDLALRATAKGLDDSALIATKLHESTMRLYASRQYLKNSPDVRIPSDLKNHRFVSFALSPSVKLAEVKLTRHDTDHVALKLAPTFAASNFQAVYEAIKADVGIGVLPEDISADDIGSGALKCVLNDWTCGRAQFYAVYPSKKFLPQRVKTLLQYLSAAWKT